MLQSPYLGDMRQEVEFWDSALQQVEEITELWFQCQKKVCPFVFCLTRQAYIGFGMDSLHVTVHLRCYYNSFCY